MTMKNFNAKRFGRTLVWTLKASRAEMFTIMTVLFMCFLAMQLLAMAFNRGAAADAMRQVLLNSAGMCLVVECVFIAIAGCYMFNNMKTKAQRIGFKMLPATDFEKFLARFLYVTVFLPVGCVAMLVLSDIVRMSLCLVIYGSHVMSVSAFMAEKLNVSISVNGIDHNACINFMGWGMLLLFHAFTIFGGTLFRRRQVVLTCLSGIMLSILFSLSLFSVFDDMSAQINESQGELLMWCVGALFTAVAIALYIGSYRLFRRMQVINNKWLNL